MFDVFHNPRVRELLQQADEATALLESGAAPQVDEALAAVYGDLGKALHFLARQRREALAPIATPETALGLAPYDQEEDDLTAIPSPDELTRHEEVLASDPEDVVGLAHLRAMPATQSRDLYALLSLLTPPGDLLDPAGMPEEASKVQWASGELSGRLADCPAELQVAVLGMLAARARNVAAHLDVDIGPRMAIDRLKRYRVNEDLPWVHGLLPNARPELDTWAQDAKAYWTLLRPV